MVRVHIFVEYSCKITTGPEFLLKGHMPYHLCSDSPTFKNYIPLSKSIVIRHEIILTKNDNRWIEHGLYSSCSIMNSCTFWEFV